MPHFKTNTDLQICLQLFQRDGRENTTSCHRLTYLHCSTQVIALQCGLCYELVPCVQLWLLSVKLLIGSAKNYNDPFKLRPCSVYHVI